MSFASGILFGKQFFLLLKSNNSICEKRLQHPQHYSEWCPFFLRGGDRSNFPEPLKGKVNKKCLDQTIILEDSACSVCIHIIYGRDLGFLLILGVQDSLRNPITNNQLLFDFWDIG